MGSVYPVHKSCHYVTTEPRKLELKLSVSPCFVLICHLQRPFSRLVNIATIVTSLTPVPLPSFENENAATCKCFEALYTTDGISRLFTNTTYQRMSSSNAYAFVLPPPFVCLNYSLTTRKFMDLNALTDAAPEVQCPNGNAVLRRTVFRSFPETIYKRTRYYYGQTLFLGMPIPSLFTLSPAMPENRLDSNPHLHLNSGYESRALGDRVTQRVFSISGPFLPRYLSVSKSH
jgi:hypothetical protein